MQPKFIGFRTIFALLAAQNDRVVVLVTGSVIDRVGTSLKGCRTPKRLAVLARVVDTENCPATLGCSGANLMQGIDDNAAVFGAVLVGTNHAPSESVDDDQAVALPVDQRAQLS